MKAPLTVFENIWLADDDIDERELFEEVIKQILPAVSLVMIANGEELMKQLETTPPPDLLFLDINMPCKDGFDCLKELRAKKEFSKLPLSSLVALHSRNILKVLTGMAPPCFIPNQVPSAVLLPG